MNRTHNPTVIRILTCATLVLLILVMVANSGPVLGIPLPEQTPRVPIAVEPTSWEPEPFAPVGHTVSPVLPIVYYLSVKDYIHLTASGEVYLAGSDGLYHSEPYRGLWRSLQAPGSVLSLSPNFISDKTAFMDGTTPSGDFVLYRTTDAGQNWQINTHTGGIVYNITFSRTFAWDRTIFVASGWVSLMRSENGGDSWVRLNSPWPNTAVLKVLLSPYYAVDHKVIVQLSNHSVWLSADKGSSWVQIDQGLGSIYGNTISSLDCVALGNQEIGLFVATKFGLIFTFDDGASWYLLSETNFSKIVAAPDFASSLAIFGIDANFQLLHSRNLGQTWSNKLPNKYVLDVTPSPNYLNDHTIYARDRSTMWTSRDEGISWSEFSSNPFFFNQLDNVTKALEFTLSPNFENDGVIFLAPSNSQLYPYIFRSQDAGETWRPIIMPEAKYRWEIAFSPAFVSDRVVFAIGGNRLYRSRDGGITWTRDSGTLPGEEDLAFRVSPNYPHDRTFFVADPHSYANSLYRSTDDGATWSVLGAGQLSNVLDIDLSPAYPADPTIFVSLASTYPYPVFKSSDNGVTWSPVNLPFGEYRISLSPTFDQDNTAFAIGTYTSSRVYRSTDRGETWSELSSVQSSFKELHFSPRYAKDFTVGLLTTNGEAYLSEDAGEHFYQIAKVYSGTYGHTPSMALSYRNGFLAPMVSNHETVQLYRWPRLLEAFSPAFVFQTGNTESLTQTMVIRTSEPLTIPWHISAPSVPWLTVTNLTGTLPNTAQLIVDPTTFTNTVHTALTLDVYWSLRQKTTVNIPVTAFYRQGVSYLPMIQRHFQNLGIQSLTQHTDFSALHGKNLPLIHDFAQLWGKVP